MTYPHNNKDNEALHERKKSGRRQRYKSEQQTSQNQSNQSEKQAISTNSTEKHLAGNGIPDSTKIGQIDETKVAYGTEEMNENLQTEKKSIEIPDPLVRYLSIKHHKSWQAFTKFATSPERFFNGFARLLQILLSGDNQDRKIFGLVPLELLDQCGIRLELEAVKSEYSLNKNGTLVLGGDSGWSWRDVYEEFDIMKSHIIDGLIKIHSNGENEEILDEIENSPVVKMAVKLFGGKVLGYVKNAE